MRARQRAAGPSPETATLAESAPREQRSLFGEILDWMLAPLLLLWPMSVALTWLVAQSIASRPYDIELSEMLRGLARQAAVATMDDATPRPALRQELERGAVQWLRMDDEDRLYFQVRGRGGVVLAGDVDLPPPGDTPAEEVRWRDERIRDESVRVAYVWLRGPAGETGPLVQLAETGERRSRLATEIIKGVILPQFLILPLAVLLVWLALARGIQPLSQLQQRIRQRESTDLSPIAERDVPEEVAPLVSAINDLLQRLDHSIAAQRHFLADAAHQLKTPLSGLRMQAELAQREIDGGRSDPAAMKHSLHQIALSSQRAAHMVNQLLAMARAENQDATRHEEDVDLDAIAREAVQDFVPRALEKRIDLGYEGPAAEASARLTGQAVLLRELVRNLVDNALRYTPDGGTVTTRVMPDPFGQVVVLQVEDNGPGVAVAERSLIFRPFYRALGTNADGSGLGLAIVQEIAEQHGAEVSIDDARVRAGTPSGALFTVRFKKRAMPLPDDG